MRKGINRWSLASKPLFPWAATLNNILREQAIEDLSGSLINLFSDYAGTHKASAYWVSSFLYMDVFASQRWEIERRIIRQRFLPQGRRLSFKGLNDGYKREALVPYLLAANEISGLCLTLAVKKTMPPLCADKETCLLFTTNQLLSHNWSAWQLDKMFQVAHAIGLLIGGLSLPRQNIFWYSDEDDIFANATVTQDVVRMISVFTQHYTRHELGKLGVGTAQKVDPGDRLAAC